MIVSRYCPLAVQTGNWVTKLGNSKITVGNARPGFIGTIAGAIALMLALVSFWAGPFPPQPSLEESVTETVLSIRDASVAALALGVVVFGILVFAVISQRGFE